MHRTSLVAAAGATYGSAALLVSAVVLVTFAFGLGQPALMAAVGGVMLWLATSIDSLGTD